MPKLVVLVEVTKLLDSKYVIPISFIGQICKEELHLQLFSYLEEQLIKGWLYKRFILLSVLKIGSCIASSRDIEKFLKKCVGIYKDSCLLPL